MVLGFPGIFAAILLIICFFFRHVWRNAAAEEEEAIRLFAVASQEAEVAAHQGGANFGSSPLVMKPHCVVCLCPTATRCSQCKAVRYCSPKCQIIHWRQGHKDECQPPILLHSNEESESVAPVTSSDHFEISADNEIKDDADSKDTHNGFASLSTPLPQFPISKTPSLNASAGEVLGSRTHGRFQTPFESGNPYIAEIAPKTVDSLTSSPVLGSTILSRQSFSNANKLKKKISNDIDKCHPRLNIQSTIYKHNKTGGGATALEEFPVSATEPWNSSSSYASERCSQDWNKNEVVFSQEEEERSLSFSGLNHHILSNTERRPVLSFDEAKTNNTQALSSEVENVPRSSQLANRGLTMLAKKIIRPFRTLEESKPSYMGISKYAAGNHKEIFPYELFVQFYSCEGLAFYPFGLINCGNSCYANAVLQCLAFTRPITSYLVQGLHSKTCSKKDWCFLCEFEHLILKGREGESPLSPIGILSEIQKIGRHLSPGSEEDAHEFLRFAIDTMQSICLEEAGVTGQLAEESTLIGLTFAGYLRSKIKCLKCLRRSEQYDRIMDLTVEIDGDIETLDEALAQFTAYEILDGENKYKCSRCKSHEKAIKRLTVHEAPNVLTIVLKRFQSGNLEKLDKFIQFTEFLNLAPYMSRSRDKYLTYHLYAVVVHLDMMNAAYSGHYICYIKNFLGEWFRVDDSTVMATDLERVLFEKAYMLLYMRFLTRSDNLTFRDTPRAPSLVRNIAVSSDAKCRRNLEAVSSGTSGRKGIPKTVASIMQPSVESPMLHQSSGKFSHPMVPNGSENNHLLQSEPWRHHSMQGNLFVDSSDSSSPFSFSDATSSSTDSTKDSCANDMSGYIFGSSLLNPSGFSGASPSSCICSELEEHGNDD